MNFRKLGKHTCAFWAACMFAISCKGFSGVFTDDKPAAFVPGSTINLPLAGGGFQSATVIDMNGDGVADGLDLDGNGVPEILFVSLGANRAIGLDVNGDGLIDYYLIINFDGTNTIQTARTSGSAVKVTSDAQGATGFDTPGASGSAQNILTQIRNDSTAPTIAASPTGGTFTGAQSITLTCSDAVACNAIAYTTDGSTPSFSGSSATIKAGGSVSLSLSSTTTVRFITRDAKGNVSAVGTQTYSIGCVLVGGGTNCALTLSGNVSTPYGPVTGSSTAGDTDGVGNAARFNNPAAIVSDGSNIYIADTSNNKNRKIVISTGAVTTLAGPTAGCYNTCPAGDTDGSATIARFNSPTGITYFNGYLYISDQTNHKIRRIDVSNGTTNTIAGPAAGCYPSCSAGDADGTGNTARFNVPVGITTDGINLYVADYTNYKIRKIAIASNVVSTLAGPLPGTIAGGTTDATSNTARFFQPYGMTVAGNILYVAEYGNNKIRGINLSTNAVTTVLGPIPGSTTADDTDASGTASRFNRPRHIATDGTYLFIVDTNNSKLRRADLSTGVVTTLAGPAAGCYSTCPTGDSDGSGNAARFNNPMGITTDGTSIFVTDSGTAKIRKVQ